MKRIMWGIKNSSKENKFNFKNPFLFMREKSYLSVFLVWNPPQVGRKREALGRSPKASAPIAYSPLTMHSYSPMMPSMLFALKSAEVTFVIPPFRFAASMPAAYRDKAEVAFALRLADLLCGYVWRRRARQSHVGIERALRNRGGAAAQEKRACDNCRYD